MIIRKATINDAEMIAKNNVKLAQETDRLNLDFNNVYKGVTAVFEDNKNVNYYIIEKDGKIKAQLMIVKHWNDWRNNYFWWIQRVYVEPESRRQGYFKALFNFVKQEAVKEGCHLLRLYVFQDNINANKTYESIGMNMANFNIFELHL